MPVALSKVAFFGNVFVSLATFGLVLCGVVFVGRKRRWKTGRTLFVIFLLTFASVMIYSFIVEAPKAYASQTDAQLQQEKVYYFYEDHIGKPIAMSEYQDYDGDGNLYYRKYYSQDCQSYDTTHIWRTNFEPFGVDDYSFNSTGIDVGAGEDCHSTLEGWEPPFRFPGQYADPELGGEFFYNHWRFYMPEIGRYTSPEPLGIIKDNLYVYAINNPLIFLDILGLCSKEDVERYKLLYNKSWGELKYKLTHTVNHKRIWSGQANNIIGGVIAPHIVNPILNFTGQASVDWPWGCSSYSEGVRLHLLSVDEQTNGCCETKSFVKLPQSWIKGYKYHEVAATRCNYCEDGIEHWTTRIYDAWNLRWYGDEYDWNENFEDPNNY